MRHFTGMLLFAALIFLFLGSLFIGRYPTDPITAMRVIGASLLPIQPDWSPAVQTVIMDVRLPRVACAMLVGAGLSMSGACYQAVFRNPLVSEFILGVSAGAGFGAALAILYFFYNPGMLQLSAFTFGLLAVGMCYGLGSTYRSTSTLVLVLSGVIVSALFTALLSLLKSTADPDGKLPVIVFWLLGSFASVGKSDVWSLLGVFVPCAGMMLALRWRLNVLALGDEEARSLGVEVVRLRALAIVLSTLIAASTVGVAGVIGWVGLVIPHAARILFGADFRKVLPASAVLGACYLLGVDDLARTVTASEIPIGVLTAIVGAPIFAVLLRRQRLGWA